MYQDYNFSPFNSYNTNYYNPFSQSINQGFKKRGLFSNFKRVNSFNNFQKNKFDWGGLLTNAQKTLNVINQAIPIFYQIKPIWNNAKIMLNIMNAVKDDDKKEKNSSTVSYKNSNEFDNNQITNNNHNGPQFFL